MSSFSDSEAAEQFERSIGWLLALVRVTGVVQFATDCASEAGRVKRRWPLLAGFAALSAQNGTAIYRRWKSETGVDESAAWLDTAMGVAMLGVEAIAAGGLNRGTGAKPGDYVLNAAMTSALEATSPASETPRIALLAAAIGVLNIGPNFRAAQLLSDSLGTLQMQIVPYATSLIRSEAEQLDRARREAVERAAEQAVVDERRAQHRFLHDSALQILEAVAGNWPIDPTLLRDRVAYEADRLADAAANADRDASKVSLERELGALATTFASQGLHVGLEIGPGPDPAPQVTRGVADAVREALVNVVKHAQTDRATVTVTRTATATRVVVSDEGCGFDPASEPHGFGLSESIGSRIAAFDGTVTIDSQPGNGTHVTLTTPI